MKKTIAFILPIIFGFALISCDSKESVIYKNLIDDFEMAEKTVPNMAIDLTKDCDDYLGKGWSWSQEIYRCATGLVSEVFFFSSGDSNIEMTLNCRPFQADRRTRQTISIYLNQKFVHKIQMSPGFRSYKTILSSKLLEKGVNFLEFRYGYAKKPSGGKNPKDNRSLSAAFKKISFHHKSLEDKNPVLGKWQNRIVQEKGSQLYYYYYIPAGSYLEVDIHKISNNLQGNIEISSDKNPGINIEIDKPGLRRIALDQFYNQYVRFLVYADIKGESKSTDAGEGTVSWSRIAISKDQQKKPDHRDISALKEFRDKIKKLDIIYIIFDAFNAEHSSLYGYARETTPFLDSLAKKGIVFDNFFANHPYTLASTGTLLTSKYSYQHGLIRLKSKLSPILPTLPEILADNEISSFLITPHGFFDGEWGLARGFTEVFFDKHKGEKGGNIKVLEEIYGSEYANRQKFIYLHLIPPHAPYSPPDKYKIFSNKNSSPIKGTPGVLRKIDRGEIEATKEILDHIKALYDANILYADRIAEDIYEFFKKKGILKNSIVIITSDHGEAFKEHGRMEHNSTIYDEMIHIPFIVLFPEHITTGGMRIEDIAGVVDVPVTILDTFSIRSDFGFEGVSFLPTIFGLGNKTHVYVETLLTSQRGIRDLNYKYINGKLFDIVKDPSESKDLSIQKPITWGCFSQRIKSHKGQGTQNDTVVIKNLDPKTIKNLKELGYIE